MLTENEDEEEKEDEDDLLAKGAVTGWQVRVPRYGLASG
jgi:hypothetical protein